jgi:hypothetical protein
MSKIFIIPIKLKWLPEIRDDISNFSKASVRKIGPFFSKKNFTPNGLVSSASKVR